jgi:hypothetical protein
VELDGFVELTETCVSSTMIAVRFTLASTITYLHCDAQTLLVELDSFVELAETGVSITKLSSLVPRRLSLASSLSLLRVKKYVRRTFSYSLSPAGPLCSPTLSSLVTA